MTAQTTPQSDAWQNIRSIHKQYSQFYELFGGSSVVVILLIFGGFLFVQNVLDDYTTNVFTEALGVISTVLIVDILNRRRADRELKEQLLFELGSNEHTTAMRALRLLQHKGWIASGELKGASLMWADLHDANLWGANLSGANLWGANLSGAKLWSASLSGAELWGVNLSGADLGGADLSSAHLAKASLSGANLWGANLSGADLGGVNLSGVELGNVNLSGAELREANLSGANLSGANLSGARLTEEDLSGTISFFADRINHVNGDATFDEKTVLPDAERQGQDDDGNAIYNKYWTPQTNMSRYTNPSHPDFWQPEWAAAGYDSFQEWYDATLKA